MSRRGARAPRRGAPGRYEGQWHKGLRSGFGCYLEPTGVKHEGHWKAGMKHGAATVRKRNGKCRDGVWKNDEFVLWSGKEYFGSSSSAMHAIGNKLAADRVPGDGDKKSDWEA